MNAPDFPPPSSDSVPRSSRNVARSRLRGPVARGARIVAWGPAALLGLAVWAWFTTGGGGPSAATKTLAQDRDRASYLPNVQRDHPAAAQQATQTPEPGDSTVTPQPPPTPTPPPTDPDALGEALSTLGLDRDFLGYRPQGDWTRWPLVERTPYLLPSFEPLFGNPLRSYAAARTMGNAADRWLRSEAIDAPDLFRATYYLGVDRKAGNLRDYSANVYVGDLADPHGSEPLRSAVRELYAYAREDLVAYSFGSIPSSPDIESMMDTQLADVPLGIRTEVGLGLRNALAALRMRDQALRHVDRETARRAFAIRDLGDSQGAGETWYPQIADVADALDEPALYYAGQRLFETGQRLRLRVAELGDAERCPAAPIDLPTPFGRVVVGTCEDDTIAGDDVLLLVEPGGNDRHLHNAGGTARIEMGVALSVDVAGDDEYDCTSIAAGACQGAGVLGVGVLHDGAGNDRYRATHHAQGLGYLGMGVLVDAHGTDEYVLDHVGQGAAFFGYGALLDADGDDRYTLLFDGQGYGGVGGGVGVLADYAGDDVYYVEPEVARVPEEYQYRNYGGNAQPNTMVSFAQGVAAGRRADGSDGHAWPGGLGAIIDVHGDDRYEAGAFAQGYGYWYGIGLVYDGAGNDTYRSVYYSLASGAHYAVSAVVDESGDDTYTQHQDFEDARAGAGIAFAWDYVTALLYDGAGNDAYDSGSNCIARTAENGQALLIDGGGDDTYTAFSPGGCFGSSRWQPYRSGDPYRQYLTGLETGVLALLLDLGGADRYQLRDRTTGQVAPHPNAVDGGTWENPDPDSVSSVGTTFRYARTFGLGIDRQGGVVPEFHAVPAPAPSESGAAELEYRLHGAPLPDEEWDDTFTDFRADPFDFGPRVPPAPPQE